MLRFVLISEPNPAKYSYSSKINEVADKVVRELEHKLNRTRMQYFQNLNLGYLHPVACLRSGDGGFIRVRNVTNVG
jgi:hypothetical protein